jgi:hypothetical protein
MKQKYHFLNQGEIKIFFQSKKTWEDFRSKQCTKNVQGYFLSKREMIPNKSVALDKVAKIIRNGNYMNKYIRFFLRN